MDGMGNIKLFLGRNFQFQELISSNQIQQLPTFWQLSNGPYKVPIPVISGVIAPISRVIIPFSHLFSAIHRGYNPTNDRRGPPRIIFVE